MNQKHFAITTAHISHIASMLPRVSFDESWRDSEGGYDNMSVEASELPDRTVHAAYDESQQRWILIVKLGNELHALYQNSDRSMLLYAGDSEELCNVMEITGPEVSVYSLMLYFGLFGPPEAVDYLVEVQNAEARADHEKQERENSPSWKLRIKSRLFDPRKEEDLTAEELAQLKDFGKKAVVFLAGTVVGTLFGIAIAK